MSELDKLKETAVYAKYLFRHGCSHAAGQDPVMRMVALHDIHNAIDWLLSALWTYHFPNENKPWKFMELYDRLSKVQTLILKRELENVNQARNQAQHHAIVPSPEALARYMGYCEAFFRETLRGVHPSLEYDQLYMGMLVPDLSFAVRSKDVSESYAQLLGGTLESKRNPADLETQCPSFVLNLRTMMIQAEKYIDEAPEDTDRRQKTVANTMVVLASCLAYAQLLALEALRRSGPGRESLGFYSPDGQILDPYSMEGAPLRAIGKGLMGSELALLPSLDLLSGMSPSGFLVDYEQLMEEIISPLVEKISLVLRNILEKLSLGIDPKKLWRFQKSFAQSTSQQVQQLNGAELTWCHDFVLSTVLDLAPMIQDILSEDLVVELDEIWGARIPRHEPTEPGSFEESELPF